jgi:cobalamin biosynthesis protein CobT
MKSGVFSDSIESSSKVFGRKDVRVVFEGAEAHTDGTTIYLPALPPAADITVDQQDIIRGFRDHESMHVRCTDTSPAGMARLKAINDAGNSHHSTILQYCEDVRIEQAGILEYPGMAHGLTATNSHAAKMLLTQLESRGKPEDVVAALPKPLQFRIMLQSIARAAVGVESGGVFEVLNEHMKAADPGLHALADRCAKQMVALPTGYSGNHLDDVEAKKGTVKSFELADEIFKAYSDYSEMTPPPPPPEQPPQPQPQQPPQPGGKPGEGEGGDGEGEKGDDGQPGDSGSGDGEGEGAGAGEGEGDGKGSGEGGEEAGDQGGAQGQGQGQGGGGKDESAGNDGEESQGMETSRGGSAKGSGNGMGTVPQQKTETPDVSGIDDADMYAKALNDVVSDISNTKPEMKRGRVVKKKGMYKSWTKRLSLKVSMQDAVMAAHSGSYSRIQRRGVQFMASIDAELSGKKAMIRRILELELQARSDRHWESGHKSGRLQSVRLVQAMQGRESVYQKRTDGKDMDTLLYISIDGSGSMDGVNAQEALKLAYALSEALERTGCDIQVEMWGNFVYQGKGQTYTSDDYFAAVKVLAADVQRRAAAKLPAEYVDVGLLTRGVIKYKRERTSNPRVREAFGIGVEALESGTPSYCAVFADLTDMARENHAKKIYLHITDGQADRPLEKQSPKDIMEEAHSLAKAVGVHMIGVGISGMQVSHLFPDNVEVSGADAYEPVIRKLAKLIAKEAGHAAGFKRAA